jgi:hypothetical protein
MMDAKRVGAAANSSWQPNVFIRGLIGHIVLSLQNQLLSAPPKKEKSVTYVSGTICYLCFGSLT